MGRPRKTRQEVTAQQKAPYQERPIPADLEPYLRDLIASRLVSGRRQRALRDGRGSGPLPYGYVRRINGRLEIDEHAAFIIRQVLQLRERHTFQETAQRLNAEGYTTAKGKQWKPGHVYKIAQHRTLYETGLREWDGVIAAERWPVMIGPAPRSA